MQLKKTLLSCLLIVVMLISTFMPAVAATTGGISVSVNNQPLLTNAATEYVNGTIMVPAKEFASSLGGSYSYDSTKMTGTVKLGENELVYRLDNSIVKFNGKYIQAPGAMRIINNRLMIPAEFTAKQFGAETYMHTWKNMLLVFQPTNGKLVYQVMPADTLWIISNIFRVSIDTIKQNNNLTGDTLYIGQKLMIKDFSAFNTLIPAKTSRSATIYSSAGWSAGVVGYLQVGTSITVVGKSGEWFKAITPKGNGYLYSSTVSITQDVSDTASNSKYFTSQIPVDTSKDSITYTSYTVKWGG